MPAERRATVDGIPVLLLVPERKPPAATTLALWMSHLGGHMDKTAPMLELLAERGLPAMSFEAPRHGSRGEADTWAFAAQTLAAFRRRMWAQLGETTLEALKVLDWGLAETGATSVVAGGDSMGGDVATALAGIDERVTRVAAVGSTPDWARPGMTPLDDPSSVLDQGTPTAYSAWLRAQLDPMLHVDRYARDVAIAFECGDADTHVPPANAEAFAAHVGDRVRVRRHPALDHLGVVRSTEAHEACADFLAG